MPYNPDEGGGEMREKEKVYRRKLCKLCNRRFYVPSDEESDSLCGRCHSVTFTEGPTTTTEPDEKAGDGDADD